MFVWDKGDLNAAQESAIEHQGSVFLVACPGSGKTRTLTFKIARLLSELQSEKKRVVAITYTHRAADEIHERIEQLGVKTSQLWIGTIHSFCLEWILKPYGIYHSALQYGFRVINAHDTERIHEDLCSQFQGMTLTHYDCDYYFRTDRFVLTSCAPEKRAAIREILKTYWQTLQKNRQLDFELILYYSYQLIKSHPSIAALLGSIFSCVLVDEYQDTREIQYEILAAILKAGKGKATAFIVGDPNQAIYGSLGGYAISAVEFGQKCGLVFKQMELSGNYRSSSRIINYFGRYNVFPSKIEAIGKVKDFSSVISYNSNIHRDALEAELVRLIQYNVEIVGIEPRDICIVAPWWVHLASMTRRLAAALPDYTFDGPGMVPFARDIDNFWYKLSRIILTEASPLLYIRRMRWAREVIVGLSDAGIQIRDLEPKSLLRACNAIAVDEVDGLTFLRTFFDRLFMMIDIDWQANLSLTEHYDAFFECSQRRIDRLAKEGALAIADIAMFRRVFAARSGITISSIHGVKGAEYDTVIAYGLLEGMVPYFNDAEKIESAKKLLYVVCSRSRKNLHLLSERGRRRRGGEDYQPTEVLLGSAFNYDTMPVDSHTMSFTAPPLGD
ncbi:UvrD-helicase domain-containing protein [Thalassospira xiamenensis]|uniref:DNA 3'-5' helicase n=1 Tax=Thalassospira xiamenensis TaxID=220697 RepID=A0ABR5XYM6_9PROT|nr:ATP-dependent helicase [Thalassospira xiamenensis]KZC98271.1 ATP-dependent DNA helicase [Thalassospira xiamenensis]KZD09701.1 ATP-dependent DNA helicase [Thalassospira xiamenensis]